MLKDAKYGEVTLERAPESALSDIEEPVFVIRGQDDLALHAITRYRNALAQVKDIDPEQVANLDSVIGRFAQFREEYADKIKVAD